MITLEGNSLAFRFPEVHQDAVLYLSFKRTLRVPDDGRTYPLPAGLGSFPLRHVDDFSNMLASHTSKRGGVLMPMWQAEAMWISFRTSYPFAIKIATGKVNAVTGKPWVESLGRNPQDYVVTPGQPWLDGYCVEKGSVRQFVAMPLGDGQTVEEQLTQRADHGGLQILAYPIKPKFYKPHRFVGFCEDSQSFSAKLNNEMGLAAGGTIRQEIYQDTFGLDAWHIATSRVFISLLNAEHWKTVTGEFPPSDPVTAKEYTQAGLPWFDWYAADQQALKGAIRLRKLRKIVGLDKQDGDESAGVNLVVNAGPQVRPIREFTDLESGQKNDF